MEAVGGLALIWLIHAGLAAALTAPVVFLGWRRVRWQWWELAIFVLPFCTWAALMVSELSTGRKTLSNLGEPLYFALAIPIAAAVRVTIGSRSSSGIVAGVLISAVCAVAAATFFIVPALPE